MLLNYTITAHVVEKDSYCMGKQRAVVPQYIQQCMAAAGDDISLYSRSTLISCREVLLPSISQSVVTKAWLYWHVPRAKSSRLFSRHGNLQPTVWNQTSFESVKSCKTVFVWHVAEVFFLGDWRLFRASTYSCLCYCRAEIEYSVHFLALFQQKCFMGWMNATADFWSPKSELSPFSCTLQQLLQHFPSVAAPTPNPPSTNPPTTLFIFFFFFFSPLFFWFVVLQVCLHEMPSSLSELILMWQILAHWLFHQMSWLFNFSTTFLISSKPRALLSRTHPNQLFKGSCKVRCCH